MKTLAKGRRALFLCLTGSAGLCFSCSAPGGPGAFPSTEFPTGSAAHPGTGTGTGGTIGTTNITLPLTCNTAQSSQAMPARTTVTSGTAGGGSLANTYFTSQLYMDFNTICGGCHVMGNEGGFEVSAVSFSSVVNQTVLNQITKVEPLMPPTLDDEQFKDRPATDPVVALAQHLQEWIDQGSSESSFMTEGDSNGAPPSASADYTLTPALGDSLTNIGSCVPSGSIGQNVNTMDQLDTFFQNATALPATLAETDLTTLDSLTLAANGVISYAPTYPLYSDGSGKMRYVRVPRGTSVVFDKATQKFHIPDNTRFYKTFLKEVVDGNGNPRYRKIETRLIVARADTDPPAGSSGPPKINALFGTYVWNDNETQATLLQDPLRNGQPFRDRLITYYTDEMKAQSIIDATPAGGNLEYALEQEPGLVRHYALPGSDRCLDCHMGSPTTDFVLGFTPLQVNRRPTGQGGVYEPAMGDELTQLQRLIDYGVISGMTSPADVVPLEESEGTRAPRNQYELNAQAYMVGNCAHCHNPRGFPTRKAPVLKDLLNFLPTADGGGVFQFPLDRTSPLRERGQNSNVVIPYITPSLRDYPAPYTAAPGGYSVPKWLDCSDTSDELCGHGGLFVSAPWRSLIYRNVDTPFDYVEDFTIFPHMPMNSAGFDCRAPRIMAEWMTSIPATKIHPNQSENVTWDSGYQYPPTTVNAFVQTNYDPQPYVEVKPTDPGYADAVVAAQARLDDYHSGHRYGFCPDTTDILDPDIVDELDHNKPLAPLANGVQDPNNPLLIIWPYIGVPMKPHWVVSDATDPPGAWNPRRPDWADPLLHGVVGDVSQLSPDDATTLQNVIAALQTVTVTSDARTVLTTKIPFGLWKPDAKCSFSGIPAAGSYQGDQRPRWMDVAGAKPTDPVYEELPGAAVFNTICFNCHGPQADAQGLLADEISIMTGGDARVADFRDGILGPTTAPGTNRQSVFVDPTGAVATQDISARYYAWMALGGTLKHLPPQLLGLVSNSPVLGVLRNTGKINPEGTPDMLKLGLELCLHVLPAHRNVGQINLGNFFQKAWIDWGLQTALIDVNGDAELWLRLCSLDNRPVVRVPGVVWKADTKPTDLFLTSGSLFFGDAYPASAPVMDHRGRVANGITADNLMPICIREPTDPTQHQNAETFLAANPVGGPGGNRIPYCPPDIFQVDPTTQQPKYQLAYTVDQGLPDYVDGKKWAARGAINAGMAVFLYLDQVERGITKVLPSYDQCESLSATGGTP
jgi:mono/diheme cytochrome c family protein